MALTGQQWTECFFNTKHVAKSCTKLTVPCLHYCVLYSNQGQSGYNKSSNRVILIVDIKVN